MKIALAQQNYHIGNFEDNTWKIIGAIQHAKSRGADLVVFSELSVCGYAPRDFLEFNDFINECYKALDIIKEHTADIGVIVGSPMRNPELAGKDLFNAAWLLYEKKVHGVAHKTLLPNYDIFDEYRYFEPAYQHGVIPFKGKKIALTICEDMWNLGDNPLYRVAPMDILIQEQPDLMINISASPFDYDHDVDRIEIIRANVLKYKLPMYCCNAVGSQTEIVFDGGSLVMNAEGKVVKQMKYFEEDFAIVDEADVRSTKLEGGNKKLEAVGLLANDHRLQSSDLNKEMRVSKVKDPELIIEYLTDEKNIQEIHQALVLGIRDYFRKMGFSKAILGSSGGIDSAVTLALACEALGKDNVRAILMPSQYSTGHSVSDAEELSKTLGNPYDIIPIKEVYDAFLSSLRPVFNNLPFGLAEENIQSRSRGNLLMAIANKFGYILLNTSNKSELATGYGTLYGDMAGGLSVLGMCIKCRYMRWPGTSTAMVLLYQRTLSIKRLRPN
nr:NAD(+) synthase [Paraflavitalea speifideiaquila]